MKKIRKNLKLITAIVVVIILICIIGVKLSLFNNEVEPVSIDEFTLDKEELVKEKEEADTVSNVFVDIKGAVVNPGVYEVESNKKVIDVVQLAGGFLENADTSMVNLAKEVKKEMVIIIYTIEEVKKAIETDTISKVVDNKCICPKVTNDACLKQNNNSTSDKNNSNNDSFEEKTEININTASIEELLTLTGIGDSKAKAIIEYREEHGKFQRIEDIMEVSGIGESLYEKIKERITV